MTRRALGNNIKGFFTTGNEGRLDKRLGIPGREKTLRLYQSRKARSKPISGMHSTIPGENEKRPTFHEGIGGESSKSFKGFK